VILSAPDGTSEDVMNRALENIRTRVDAFGTAEPIMFVTGRNIEVQIPGLARGTIEERAGTRYCIVDDVQASFGCFEDQAEARTVVDEATVSPLTRSACLTGDLVGEEAPCFGTEAQARDAIGAFEVRKREGEFCVTGTGLAEDPCLPTREEAEAAIASTGVELSQEFCIAASDDRILRSDLGAACSPTEDEADEQLASLSVSRFDQRYCVVSSADRPLGCFLSREDAQARLQETGQERLLQVIGQTARLEFREVIGTITSADPAYAATPVDCSSEAATEEADCSFEALRDREVVLFDQAEETKYTLSPVQLTGDAIDGATAVFDSGGQTSLGQGWLIDFTMTDAGAATFGDLTTRLAGTGGQLAIVVDRQVISAPTVDEPITGGRGVITGSFTENRAKDLATQLNAGALPVELTTQQVLTVSPTLGAESLEAGIVAGVAGLVLLALYLLFYYRILAVVAWLGMTIWAVLALALIALAGRTVGYSLTLAGVAGLVISLGVTADSYIVFFERFKDEVHAGKTPRTAVQPAFKKSFRTIVAADIVTALAAIVLYLTAISSVRGFALTLGVAVLLDLFVVYFFKRPAVFLLARNERLVTMPVVGVTSGVAADHEVAAAGAGAGR
jgi:preprotein translocase subunit SecD